MGQKVNPRALRLKGVQEFLNNWFSLDSYSVFLVEDDQIRQFIEKKLKRSFMSKLIIKRKSSEQIILDIFTSKPGIVLGKGGESINNLKRQL